MKKMTTRIENGRKHEVLIDRDEGSCVRGNVEMGGRGPCRAK